MEIKEVRVGKGGLPHIISERISDANATAHPIARSNDFGGVRTTRRITCRPIRLVFLVTAVK